LKFRWRLTPKLLTVDCSLTTEYPANGSFSDHTHAVCMKHHVDGREATSRSPVNVKFEFLMVKLLRVYGECLGTKSR
jgi:hypothetical protein